MRSFYGVDRLDNAYFLSETFAEALLQRDYLFTASTTPALLQSLSPQPKKIRATTSTNMELALVLFAPPIVASNEFVFVLDDLQRSKFNMCAVLRLPSTYVVERSEIEFLF